ncbi:MAG: TetR family transcriptional regulator [Flammeovirgaceae bacterium]|nr:TetR family transcriptional regulator [Flammeovirgaceae bacterium]
MSRRRQQIIDRSVRLFNERGFHDVSIKQISDALQISSGNLTYYFTKKTDLLKAIQHQLIQETAIDIMPSGYITLYHFEEIFKNYSEIQAKYHFYYNNLQYIFKTFPKITRSYQVITRKRFRDAKLLINYYIKTGRLKPENEKINYQYFIRTIWMISVFWKTHTLMTDDTFKDQPSQLDILWSNAIPLMTEKGYQEYLEIIKYNQRTVVKV